MMGNLMQAKNWNLKKMTKIGWNQKIVEGLGLELRIFNLTHQKRSEAKVDLGSHIKNMSK